MMTHVGAVLQALKLVAGGASWGSNFQFLPCACFSCRGLVLYTRSIFFGGVYQQQGNMCIKGDLFMDTLRFNRKIEPVT